MRRVVILRPEPGASETRNKARALGLDAIAVPLFEVEPLRWSPPNASGFDAILLTSANAIRHGGEGLERFKALPVHAVGAATARAARDAGFEVATTGDEGVDRLLSTIAPELRLLHLCGEDRKTPSRRVTAIPVYRSRAVEAPEELKITKNAVVLVHSPRAAARFAELGTAKSSIVIAAISDAAAEAAGSGWASVEVADAPSDDALLALATRLCDKAR